MAEVINLTRGNPDAAAFSIDDLIKWRKKTLKGMAKSYCNMGHAPGYALRDACGAILG